MKKNRKNAYSETWSLLGNEIAGQIQVTNFNLLFLGSFKLLLTIKLRQGDNSACRHMLAKLDALDPGDSVGASVIREIHAGAH